jgi:hypothetical protein
MKSWIEKSQPADAGRLEAPAAVETVAPGPAPADALEAPRQSYSCDEKLRAQLLAFRNAGGPRWSNAAIAAEIGYSVRVVADYLNPDGCKYDGGVLAAEKRIREFLRDQRLISDTSVETIECEVATQIAAAIEDIRTARRIGAIVGPPGIGKSRGIGLYCQTHELAISFTTWEGQCSKGAVTDLLWKTADVARIKPGENKAVKLAEKLSGSGRVIIPDDAHKLSAHALQLFYDFRDLAGTAIAFVGDERLLPKLEADGQRLRRTGVVYELKVRDPLPLIDHHIAELITTDKPSAKELESLRGLCKTIAQGAGMFGSVQMELSLAGRIKRAMPDLSWAEAVRHAHKRLIRSYSLP